MNALGWLILIGLYLFPWVIAEVRGHRQHMAIGVLNLLGGWTGLLWLGALVWACTADVERKPNQWNRAP
jgi:Superinfection immunity protein